MNPNQFMHQKQIVVFRDHMYVVDGFGTFRGHPGQFWIVLEDLDHPLHMFGLGRPFETIRNLILMHELIRNRCISGSAHYFIFLAKCFISS